MAIRLVRQTINPHTIRQAIVCTEWPSVWYARLLAPKLFVRPVLFTEWPSVWYARLLTATLFVRPVFLQNSYLFGTPDY